MAATAADKPGSVPTAMDPSTDSNPNDPVGKPDLSTNDVSPAAVSNTEDTLDDSKPSVVSATSAAGDSAAPASNIQKKMKRAERFGMPVQLSEEEKRNCRAERFGTAQVSNGSEAHKHSEELKRKARAERFGLPVPSPGAVEDAKKKARLARFASGAKSDPQEEEKRKARALRFSNPSPSSLSPVNGQGSVEANVVVAGKAGGTS